MGRYAEVLFNIPVSHCFFYRIPDGVPCAEGCRVVAPLGKRNMKGVVVGVESGKPPGDFQLKDLDRIVDESPIVTPELLDLARWMSRTYICSPGEALHAMIPGGRKESEGIDLSKYTDREGGGPESLAEEQQLAVETVLGARTGAFYLDGVTGSGKTEVFLRVARRIHGEGKSVIYLVPEISLVHQVVERFVSEFGQGVSVLHSGMTGSQRLKQWMKALSGEARIVIGARSAVFAPVRNLGLVVIDEEHENSYKSSSTPRYHARQVAAHRCRTAGALLLMGSATPSTEAYYQMDRRRITRIRLPRRLSGGAMPSVELVDMRSERGLFSRRLVRAIREVHGRGGQAILFLNRRGFAHLFFCRSCGYEMKCRRCSVALTLHRDRNLMVCHYCGYRAEPPAVCPECGSLDIGYSGFGTERVEEELRRLFPGLTACRVDTDSVKDKRKLEETLVSFREGRIDLLLGTQMVAKGLNFPGVKLVGIVSADVGLQLPDFRALERAFSLIVQVSGRAGRISADGRVLVQTFKPENAVLAQAAAGNQEAFYRDELEMRRRLRFPPFYRLIRLVVRGRRRKTVEETARQLAERLGAAGGPQVEILGPVECPLFVIAGNVRWQILLRSERFGRAHAAARTALEGFPGRPGVFVEVDIDPISLL